MKWHEYRTREQLAEALATGVAAILAGGIATRGAAVLAVSGGSTPARFFARLSQAELAWEQVTILPVDERMVGQDHPRSNFGLIRRTLCVNAAAAAQLLPLFVPVEGEFAPAVERAEAAIAPLGQIDAAVLGMGNDGHTASLFAGGDCLGQALDADNPRWLETMRAPGASEARVTLTLRRLLAARFLALHIEGREKRQTLERALEPGPVAEMPVRAVLDGAGERLQVFWAP